MLKRINVRLFWLLGLLAVALLLLWGILSTNATQAQVSCNPVIPQQVEIFNNAEKAGEFYQRVFSITAQPGDFPNCAFVLDNTGISTTVPIDARGYFTAPTNWYSITFPLNLVITDSARSGFVIPNNCIAGQPACDILGKNSFLRQPFKISPYVAQYQKQVFADYTCTRVKQVRIQLSLLNESIGQYIGETVRNGECIGPGVISATFVPFTIGGNYRIEVYEGEFGTFAGTLQDAQVIDFADDNPPVASATDTKIPTPSAPAPSQTPTQTPSPTITSVPPVATMTATSTVTTCNTAACPTALPPGWAIRAFLPISTR